jgi:hypothetical protein
LNKKSFPLILNSPVINIEIIITINKT